MGNQGIEPVKRGQRLTSQSFGADFQVWRTWWMAAYADAAFDFDSQLGLKPRTWEHG